MPLDLTNQNVLTSLLRQHHLYTQKNFGQHFLIDQAALDAIVQTASIQPTDTIVEIGPGLGVLTQELSQRAQQVISFEIDNTLQPILQQTVGEYPNLHIIFQDFLKANLEEVLSSQFAVQNQNADDSRLASSREKEAWDELSDEPIKNNSRKVYKLVANLPYNAGSHILDVLLKSPNPPQSITVLLQKEVAQKITALPPHATYLSNFFQLYGTAKIIQIVPPSSFFPPPQVDSAILHIKAYPAKTPIPPLTSVQISHRTRPDRGGEEETWGGPSDRPQPPIFSKFLHRGFSQPRKMLNKSFTKQELSQANIDHASRPENLTLTDWLDLFHVVNHQE